MQVNNRYVRYMIYKIITRVCQLQKNAVNLNHCTQPMAEDNIYIYMFEQVT